MLNVKSYIDSNKNVAGPKFDSTRYEEYVIHTVSIVMHRSGACTEPTWYVGILSRKQN